MNEIEKYTQALVNTAKSFLSKEYNLGTFQISDFQAINFYLIDRALNRNKNLFIQSFNADSPSLSQFPTVLSVAISLFFKNFCDDKTTYEIGEVLQKDGIRFEITGLTTNGYSLKTNHQGGYTREASHKSIKNYIVTNADLSDRRVKTRFDDYRKLFKLVYNADYVPSKFNYKAAIILEKKEFDEELKNQHYTDIDILKAIPLRWISKNGTESWNHIPIAPMIYCVPDFETLEEYVLDKGERIEALIIIGKNKYKDDDLTRIKRDLREKIIPVSIILGNEPIIDSQEQFIKWNWTFDEFAYLHKAKKADITCIPVTSVAFNTAINNYLVFLSDFEDKFSVKLSNIRLLRHHLYPLTWAIVENSRNINQSEFVRNLILRVSEETLSDILYNQNEEPDSFLEENKRLIAEIFDSFTNAKLYSLYQLSGINMLVVPDMVALNWKQEYKPRYKILSYKEFLEYIQSNGNVKNIAFLSLFGYEKSPSALISELLNSQHNYYVLSYPEEQILIENIRNKIYNATIREYKSHDRKRISGLEFELNPKPVSVSDIIEDLHGLSLKEHSGYEYGEIDSINYCLKFKKEVEPLICEGSKSVLLFGGGVWNKCKISNLRPGDKVRIYNNLSKDRLFSIASQEDTQGRFNKIEQDSKCWKQALKDYFQVRKKSLPSYGTEDLLIDLQAVGLTISNVSTIKKWLNMDDKERFPSSLKNLLAIKSLVKSATLDAAFESIKRSRRMYRGVMIALGRDLSDEVMDYIMSQKQIKGKILKSFSKDEINVFVENSAPERVILTISITEEDESI